MSENSKMEHIDWEKAHAIFTREKVDILKFLEKESNRYPTTKEILMILAAGTLLSASLFMPGLAKVVNPYLWQARGYKKHRLRQTLKRLHKQKIVEVLETKDGPIVKITEHGLVKALKYKLEEMKVVPLKKWDKKWHIVIFDIPDQKKRIRDEFRKRLKQLGCYPIQESVFVHKFKCIDEVEFLRQMYGVDVSVTYIVAEKIEGQENLEKFFERV